MGTCQNKEKIPNIKIKDNEICNNNKCHSKCLSTCCIVDKKQTKHHNKHHHHHKKIEIEINK